jgi:Holliday junction DNA helicase RuvB
MEDRYTDPRLHSEEKDTEQSLRPQKLDDFIGQGELRQKLKVYIQAAGQRKEPIDHTLFYGPPGLGKTTLAFIMAHEMGVNIKISSGPVLTKPGDLAAILTNLEAHDILFVDEIHRLNRSVEEILYSAMEDFELDIIIGKGPGARNIRIPLQPFTLVGATTRAGLLTSPLRDRFGVMERLEFYGIEEITTIIKRSARILNVTIQEDPAREIAKRSRFTPRVANRLLKRVRDFAEVQNDGVIDGPLLKESFRMLHIDSYGLEKMDREILAALIDRFEGGPVGLDTLAVMVGEEKDTIEDLYEPFLMRSGFVQRTPRGRCATPLAYDLLGREMKKELFSEYDET